MCSDAPFSLSPPRAAVLLCDARNRDGFETSRSSKNLCALRLQAVQRRREAVPLMRAPLPPDPTLLLPALSQHSDCDSDERGREDACHGPHRNPVLAKGRGDVLERADARDAIVTTDPCGVHGRIWAAAGVYGHVHTSARVERLSFAAAASALCAGLCALSVRPRTRARRYL